jgi:phage tail sheath protein FI
VPEYLAPGVYVEEVSFRSKSIEGVGTSTSAFVGPTRKGPVGITPELLTSFAEFERIYGGEDDLDFGDDPLLNRNYIAHAARAFFNNGGARLYVVRIQADDATVAEDVTTPVIAGADGEPPAAWFSARFAGLQYEGATVDVQQVAQPIGLMGLRNAPNGTLVRVYDSADEPALQGFYAKADDVWTRGTAFDEGEAPADTPDLLADFTTDGLRAEALSVNVTITTAQGNVTSFEGLALGAQHPQFIGAQMAFAPSRRSDQLTLPVGLRFTGAVPAPDALLEGLGGGEAAAGVEPVRRFTLTGGADGTAPGLDQYSDGFGLLVGLEDVSIVAAPGYSARYNPDDLTAYQGIQDALITHVSDPRRYRMAVLDAPPDVTPGDMRNLRGLIDSTRAALYYPWVVAANPLASPRRNEPAEILLPPSGYVCGIYARNDIERGVYKAPANEVVRGALRFEPSVNMGQQELLNPLGVNCLRALSGRGLRVWGARTVSSDPEWKYLNVRRYFNYLGASIDRGTQWAVFEPNGELLWANVRGTIGDFLYNEWRSGALLGSKQEEAFFVRCDRTTMTQNDLDNGRLICLIGVAVVKPAEFVIFRIGQKTADAKS